ncbi:MATH and LRR domain-containing protein PFE0570w [Diabrotica virgifera virgifera]|uniref:non-specific serine/threonine protein kinase n=1 Tax=Diabrotica virgifera virgifera TaxID=50390 RepID=A0ABM5INV2_DIAVI|nr:MATH and LRR domain-containing protein PFE0570w [Diabrotica virgifera virgifera]
MAPTKKVRTYVNSNTSLVNNSIDAFNILFAKNMTKRLLGRKKQKIKIQELPTRRNCESLLNDDSLQISTEDTFDKLLKTKKTPPKLTILESSNSNSVNESKVFLSSPKTRRQKANFSLTNDSNSQQSQLSRLCQPSTETNDSNSQQSQLSHLCQPSTETNDSNSQQSQLSRLYQPSTERIEESLEIEIVKKKQPKTSLSYITIPKNKSLMENSSNFAANMQKKLIHCSTPIAASKAQIQNYTISPINVNSLLKKSFEQIDSWNNEFPAPTSTNTPLRRLVIDKNHSKYVKSSKVLKEYSPTVNHSKDFNSPGTRTSFITLRHRKVIKSYRKRHKNISRKNKVISFESSRQSIVNFVTKRKNTNEKHSSHASFKESDNINEEKNKELCIQMRNLSVSDVRNSVTNFEKFYSRNLSSQLMDNTEDLSDVQGTSKVRSLFVSLSRKSLDCEDFEEFFVSNINHQINSKSRSKENLRHLDISKNKVEYVSDDNNVITNHVEMQNAGCDQDESETKNDVEQKCLRATTVKLQKRKSQEDTFDDFLRKNMKVIENNECSSNYSEDGSSEISSKFTYNKSDISYKRSYYLRSNSEVQQCEIQNCSEEYFFKTLNLTNNKIGYKKKKCKDLRINLTNLPLLQSKEDEFESFFVQNLGRTGKDEYVHKEDQKDLSQTPNRLKVVLNNNFGHDYLENKGLEHNRIVDLRINLRNSPLVQSKEEEFETFFASNLSRDNQDHYVSEENQQQELPVIQKELRVVLKNIFGQNYLKDVVLDHNQTKDLRILTNSPLMESKEEDFESFYASNLDLSNEEQVPKEDQDTLPLKQKQLKIILTNVNNAIINKYTDDNRISSPNGDTSSDEECQQISPKHVFSNKQLVVKLIENDYSHLMPISNVSLVRDKQNLDIVETNLTTEVYSELQVDKIFMNVSNKEHFETFYTKNYGDKTDLLSNSSYDSDIIESSIIDTFAIDTKRTKNRFTREISSRTRSSKCSITDNIKSKRSSKKSVFVHVTAEDELISDDEDARCETIGQADNTLQPNSIQKSRANNSSQNNRIFSVHITAEESFTSPTDNGEEEIILNNESRNLRSYKKSTNNILDSSEHEINISDSSTTEKSLYKNSRSKRNTLKSKENISLNISEDSTAKEGSPNVKKKSSKSRTQRINEDEEKSSSLSVQVSYALKDCAESSNILVDNRISDVRIKETDAIRSNETLSEVEGSTNLDGDYVLSAKNRSSKHRKLRSKRKNEEEIEHVKVHTSRSKNNTLVSESPSKINEANTNSASNVSQEKNQRLSVISDHVDSSYVDPNHFKVPKSFKSPKAVILKAGKSWRRSLSLYKRSTLFSKPAKDDPSSPFTTKAVTPVKSPRSNPSRLSVRFVAVKPLPVLQVENNTVLEDYAINASYVPDQIFEASLEDSFGCLSLTQNQQRNNSISKNQQLGVPVTAREIVLRKCGQTEPIQFSQCFTDSILQNCQKIGEGVYGEVFLLRNPDGGTSVLKIIPVEGDQIVNGERQKKFEEVLSEIIITIELSNLRHNKRNGISSFTEVQKIQCVQGTYPEKLIDLWDLFDETRGSENDCPDMFKEDQLYIVFQMAYGGKDLESFVFNNAMQAYSMFQQVALGLAIAEEELQFEHRDLHWGNVLISTVETNKIASFTLENKTYDIPTIGVEVAIIDYTLSRIEHDGVVIFNDLGLDPDLFTAEGDYQFDIYRLMQEKNRNNWKDFEPFSNLLWLHYILDKAILGLRYKAPKSKLHKAYLRKLKNVKDDILSYHNVKDFIVANLLDI